MYRFFLIAVLLIVLYYLIRRAIRKIGQDGALEKPKDGRLSGNQMVQDPVCRVFVARENAVKENIGGQTYFFCSRGCAAAFEKQLSG
ncbi:MAG TPA: YHS domain-containing protein [Nitrospira sp.]|mgnify:FL=1|nr:YHS domain-containing protein [Nitrospira sp.]MCW5793002.1 YHS domain-containing protein [Nitrospira sp.]HMU28920.1 YHS domain-containing protein [Nitrospira sp.]HMW84843.1 YHS domain-containing protein [Nitrospira sp.]HMX90618.1 YHS domain-containing protein [Nitrospira sp.]